jgi:hypothetical protein
MTRFKRPSQRHIRDRIKALATPFVAKVCAGQPLECVTSDLHPTVVMVKSPAGRFAYDWKADRIVAEGEPLFPAKHVPLVEIAPDARKGKPPCGECHLQPRETCDICGAAA